MRVLLALIGVSFGLFVSAGAFTVLLAAGMITRFSGKLAIAKQNIILEECVIAGTLLANIKDMLLHLALLEDPISHMANQIILWLQTMPTLLRYIILAVEGVFMGIFVGCLAMTIAELIDAIPIFARRTHMKKGLECAVFAIALGKTIGSLLYFQIYH